VRFQVLTVTDMKTVVLGVVAPCSLVEDHCVSDIHAASIIRVISDDGGSKHL
jgi:hypothetical protein